MARTQLKHELLNFKGLNMKHLLSKFRRNKYFLYCLLVVGLLSCSTETEAEKLEGWYLRSYYDNGWLSTTIKCDSLQMISKTEAIVWVNGKETKIFGEQLLPFNY